MRFLRAATSVVAAGVVIGGFSAQASPRHGHTHEGLRSAPAIPATPSPRYPSVVSKYVMIPMDDGVRLGATITFPSIDGKTAAKGRFPVVFEMTPYGRDGTCGCNDQSFYPEHGIVSAVVDVRGTGGSEGNLDRNYFAPREARDGYDVTQWFGTRSWSNGRVAIDGGSYLGIMAYLIAEQRPSHLVAIAPEVALSDIYRDAFAPGGVLSAFFDAQYPVLQGGLGLAGGDVGEPGDSGAATDTNLADLVPGLQDSATAKLDQAQSRPIILDYLDRPNDDRWYRQRSPWYGVSKIEVPTLIMDGWRDGSFVRGDLEMYEALAKRRGVETRLDVYGCTHKGCGAPFDPTQSSKLTDNLQAEEFQFLSHYLLGTPEHLGPRVRFDLQPGSAYFAANAWPPRASHFRRWYLGPTGTTGQPVTGAATVGRLGKQASGRHRAEYFTDPTSGLSMAFNSQGTIAASPYVPTDQRLEDVHGLTWRSARARTPERLVGPLDLHLVASSTATDTDWVVRLSDVAPDGSEHVTTEGDLRASDRALDRRRSSRGAPYHLDTSPQPIKPGKPYAYDVAIIPTAYELARGHELQVRITSDDLPTRFPGWVRLDEKNPAATKVDVFSPAVNTVYEGRKAPHGGSWLLVPLAGR